MILLWGNQMVRIALLAALFFVVGGWSYATANEGGGHAKPPEAAEPAEPGDGKDAAKAKKPAKPKPKRPDKEKNCAFERPIDVEVDGKHFTLPQAALKNVMRGAEADLGGYTIHSNPDKLILTVRTPDGSWYVANMTRLGDLDEGCVFYMIGQTRPTVSEPPLF